MDMDGVITGEEEYWKAAEYTVYEILCSKEYLGLDSPFPPDMSKPLELEVITRKFIGQIKASGINSNWDLAFFSLAVFMSTYLEKELKENNNQETVKALWKVCREKSDGKAFERLRKVMKTGTLTEDNIDSAAKPLFDHCQENTDTGDLYRQLNNFVGTEKEFFVKESPLWKLVHDVFQRWYLGSNRVYQKGFIHEERPIVPLDKLRTELKKLKDNGCTLGVATGRPRGEIVPLLERWGLLKFFDRRRLCTFDTIHRGEKEVFEKAATKVNFSKPSPYVFLKAILPEFSALGFYKLLPPYPVSKGVIIVGDAAGDLMAANEMGVLSVLVETGVGGKEGAKKLMKHRPSLVLRSVLGLAEALEDKRI